MIGDDKLEREDAIRDAARHLGFRRVGSRIREAFKSAISSGIRRGRIAYDRDSIWKVKNR